MSHPNDILSRHSVSTPRTRLGHTVRQHGIETPHRIACSRQIQQMLHAQKQKPHPACRGPSTSLATDRSVCPEFRWYAAIACTFRIGDWTPLSINTH